MKLRWMLSVVCILTMLAAPVLADQTMDHEEEVVELKAKICPVSGEPIGSMGDGVEVEHEGKTYKLCCAMCAKYFDRDPQKYIEIIKQQQMDDAQESQMDEHQHDEHDHSEHIHDGH